ncbi:lysophospholipid acyltransferase [Tulasnella sp. 427]|nr:lysophospholipid acyltransferase [Tulasnella sp. 427]
MLVLPMAVLDRLRRDAAVHQPRVELCWAALVAIAWLAAAMFFTLQMQGFPSCSIYRDSQFGWCRLHMAAQVLLWVGFVILVFIILGILTFCLYNSRRGYPYVWSTAISDFEITPKLAPSVMFERERQERAQALDDTLASLQMQQRYQASLADSGPPRDRPPSPTLSVRSAMRSLGYVPERVIPRLTVERNPSEQTLPVSIRSARHVMAAAQHIGVSQGPLAHYFLEMEAIDKFYDAAGAAAGVHGSQLKLLTCFVVSYPLGSVFVRIPKNQPAVKHLFSISVTLFFLWGMLKLWLGSLNIFGSALFTYFMAGNVRGRQMPWIVFGHWIRYMWPTDAVEISGPQMVLTMKLTTFAWNVYDGQEKLESLDESQKETRIPKLPSLLEFFGYVFYFPAFLIGPSLTFSDYMALIDETLYEGAAPASPNSSKRVPVGRKRVAYQKLVLGVSCIAFYALYGGQFNYAVTAADWYVTKPFWYRFLYTQVMGLLQRVRYYGAWSLTEGGCIFTGLGFNGFAEDGSARWNKAANIDVMNIEFAPNIKVLLDNWNINTNTWLRNSVYKRLAPPGKKPGALVTMYTFMTSAIWHGIYPGYYLTFFLGGLVSTAARHVRTYIRPFFLPALLPPKSKVLPPPSLVKRAYDVVGTMATLALLNYLVAPFMLLELRPSVQAWNSMLWYGHGLVLLWLGWGQYLGGFRWLGKLIKVRAEKAASKDAMKLHLELEEREKKLASGMMTPSSSGGTLAIPPFDVAVKGMEEAGDALKLGLAQGRHMKKA